MGLAVKFSQGKEWERRRRWRGRGGIGGGKSWIDLEVWRCRGKAKGGDPAGRSSRDPDSPPLRKGLFPWRPPGSPSRRHDSGQGLRSSLTSGLKLLWAELREASAVASASTGSSRLQAGGGVAGMVRDRPGSRAVRAPQRGPSPGISRRHSLERLCLRKALNLDS